MVVSTITESGPNECTREYSRVNVSWPVILHTAEGLIDGEMRNASIEGALIHCQQSVAITEPFEVSIEIPGSVLPILATVEIIRSYAHNSDAAYSSCDLAVRFLEMSKEGRRVFCTAVERQARTCDLPPLTVENTPIALHEELLEAVERLSIEFQCSLDDLLEEALEDLVRKYEKQQMTVNLESDRDQRQSNRVEVSWPVVVKASNKSIKGQVRNISSKGALVCCHQLPSLDLDQTFQLQIKIPEHNYVFSIPACLVRFDISDRGSAFFRYSLAFRFVEVSESDLVFLSEKVLHTRT
jgi:hypothetical protein